MSSLRSQGIYLNEHKLGMKDLDSVGLGWFMGPHSDVCDLNQKEHDLNNLIHETLTQDKTRWLNWIHSQNDNNIKNFKECDIPFYRSIQDRANDIRGQS